MNPLASIDSLHERVDSLHERVDRQQEHIDSLHERVDRRQGPLSLTSVTARDAKFRSSCDAYLEVRRTLRYVQRPDRKIVPVERLGWLAPARQ